MQDPTPKQDVERNAGQDVRRNTILGIALVALGIFALLSNVGIVAGVGNVVGALFFAAIGTLLVRAYARRDWVWSLPVAFAFFGLAMAAFADGPMSGPYFLGLTGVGFLFLYAFARTRWWAILPGGTLLTLGVVAAIDELALRWDEGPVLFFGLAATFAAVWAAGQRWALWPAVALGAFALLLTLSTAGGWIVPLLLIAAGLWLLYRQSSR